MYHSGAKSSSYATATASILANKSKSSAGSAKKRVKHCDPVINTPADGSDLVVRKRMASLNATAMLAASYEVERHLDMDSLYNDSSSEDSDVDNPPSPKPEKTSADKKKSAGDKIDEVDASNEVSIR